MANFYMSDTHFGHENIIKLDANNGCRKFSSIEEHDNLIISNINKVVTTQDNLYFLGDISWKYAEQTIEILKQINCKNLFAIKGNHDRALKDGRVKKMFQGIYDYKTIKDGENTVVMSHFPILFYEHQHRNSILLYGHVHNTREEKLFQDACKNISDTTDIPMNCYNVGCMLDYMDYTPRTLEEIIKMNKTN